MLKIDFPISMFCENIARLAIAQGLSEVNMLHGNGQKNDIFRKHAKGESCYKLVHLFKTVTYLLIYVLNIQMYSSCPYDRLFLPKAHRLLT